jgi:hypothetical protein
VSAFGSITAVTYSLSGKINWPVAILFLLGGIIGRLYGTKISSKVPKDKLKKIFAILLIVVTIYIIIKSMDIIGESCFSVVDDLNTMILGNKSNIVKVLSWYDNEWSFACTLVDLIN